MLNWRNSLPGQSFDGGAARRSWAGTLRRLREHRPPRDSATRGPELQRHSPRSAWSRGGLLRGPNATASACSCAATMSHESLRPAPPRSPGLGRLDHVGLQGRERCSHLPHRQPWGLHARKESRLGPWGALRHLCEAVECSRCPACMLGLLSYRHVACMLSSLRSHHAASDGRGTSCRAADPSGA